MRDHVLHDTDMQNFAFFLHFAIGSAVSASQIRDFAVPFDVASLNGIFTQNTPEDIDPGKEMLFGGHDDYI